MKNIKQYNATIDELIDDMEEYCTNTTKLIETFTLPDGRKAQIHISIEANEDNFISEPNS